MTANVTANVLNLVDAANDDVDGVAGGDVVVGLAVMIQICGRYDGITDTKRTHHISARCALPRAGRIVLYMI